MPFAAILFDLDGTLVSTIDVYFHAVRDSFREIGITVTKEQFDEWYKRPVHLEGVLAEHGLTEEDVPQIRGLRDRMYIERLKTDTTWIDGAEELLARVTASHPVAIVTGSHMSYVNAIDERLGIKRYVQTYVTADEVGKFMKPHPHGLVLAADLLGVDTKECLYVGDQAFDMVAARACGMTGCLVPSAYTPAGAAREADMVVERLSAVLALTTPPRRNVG